jgi:hypothetical protein
LAGYRSFVAAAAVCYCCVDRYWILMNSYISFNGLRGKFFLLSLTVEQVNVLWGKFFMWKGSERERDNIMLIES